MKLFKFFLPVIIFLDISTVFAWVWPTPNRAFIENKPTETYIQPTSSGRVESGLFGCTRNSGWRFHAGIDLKPIYRNKQKEPLDPIYAIQKGKVVMYNKTPSRSSYGRFIVIEHCAEDGFKYLSLYGHLSSIANEIKIGQAVKEGQKIGIMGRSANHPIPKERAHLHFQISILYSSNFDSWYKKQKFSSPNYFGNFNGLNMASLDPLDIYKRLQKDPNFNIVKYIKSLPVALEIIVSGPKGQDLAHRYPQLIANKHIPKDPKAWKIAFTAYGFPKSLTTIDNLNLKENQMEIIYTDNDLIQKTPGTYLLKKDKKNHWTAAKRLERILEVF